MAYPVDDFEDNSGRAQSSSKGLELGKGISKREAPNDDGKKHLKGQKRQH